ncbi:hypothetical protein CLV84_2219 [Neolewinella xylanilytica]|uniref:Uncharacterized protein n=1 Tax=Neolewinella xylanilytica TaxID=1514080 RepID=A0A2S6I2B9_9BACT|nr:hypothetical protein [Neolewinella xylanilytica]PPK85324.1 hypothetical protein CLV84_2219 [Neolewinella xylanilytica]
MDLCNLSPLRPGAILVLGLFATSLLAQSAEPSPRLRDGMVISMQFLPENAPLSDADVQAKGDRTASLLRGERGRYEGRGVMLTLVPEQTELTTTEGEDRQDYLIIDSGDPITRNWLQPGAIWGFHTILLMDSINRSDFETFIHRYWSPTRSDALPDSKLIFLKNLSGPDKGEFSYIWLIDSEETRDYYFPEAKVPSKMYTEFEKGWNWIYDPEYLGKYLAAPEDELFTDFVVVR